MNNLSIMSIIRTIFGSREVVPGSVDNCHHPKNILSEDGDHLICDNCGPLCANGCKRLPYPYGNKAVCRFCYSAGKIT